MMTTYARKECRYGTIVYVGYIKCTAGQATWTESTCIPTLRKKDALAHAARLKADHEARIAKPL